MPNWCENRVAFSGCEKDLSKLKNLIGTDLLPISFQKIRPMPEELEVVDGSPMVAWQALYSDWAPLLSCDWIIEAGVSNRKELITYLEKEHPEWIGIAHRYQSNLKQYGFRSWYDWRIEHWGTKWDVTREDISSVNGDEEHLSLVFDTAGSPPEGIHDSICTLIEQNDLAVAMTWFYDEPGMRFAGYL